MEAIDKDHINIGGEIYKKLKTINGRYSKEDRTKYMRAWRAKQNLLINDNYGSNTLSAGVVLNHF